MELELSSLIVECLNKHAMYSKRMLKFNELFMAQKFVESIWREHDREEEDWAAL